MSNKSYHVGVYIRLSRENTAYKAEDSLSIENQQAMLSKFINIMPGWIEKKTYIDNGATGGNFNRQGFQEMMKDAKQGKINLVLVQDLSRFGRNYLETGKYLEDELPALGCRFVALSDGIDTETGENDIMPFLNAMNDYYLKNLSDRIKSVLTAKAKDRQKLSGTVPYGYDRNPAEHTRLIVDEYAAEVVKRIFEMRAAGIGYSSIAGVLNRENILPPRLYYFQRQNREAKQGATKIWKDMTVKMILRNELYLGHTIAFKKKTRSYRDSRQVKRDPGEWIKNENTHTPLVDDALWQTVQKMNEDAKRRFAHCREQQPSLFAKILVCSDCKTNMFYSMSIKNYPKGMMRYGGYHCRTHLSSGRTVCSWHRVSETNLKKLVLSHIKEMGKLIDMDEDRMLRMLQERLIGGHRAGMHDLTKERRELKQQLYTLETQAEQFYEDKVSGVITVEDFTAKANKVETQRLQISDRLTRLTQVSKQAEAKLSDIEQWVSLIKEKSTHIEVDRDLLESLIDKIEIGEKLVVNGVKTQDVKIFYKFVGLC